MNRLLLFALLEVGILAACDGDSVSPVAADATYQDQGSISLAGGPTVKPMRYCDGSDCDGGGGPSTVVETSPVYGYNLGFSMSACKAKSVSGSDFDSDGLDDQCESSLAAQFAPRLHWHSGESYKTRETYWAAHRKYSCGAATKHVGYGGVIYGECVFGGYLEVVRVMYLLGYHDDKDHPGDSEFHVVDIAYASSDNTWRTSRVFMSAHAQSIGDHSYWWYHYDLEWDGSYGGRPFVWVAVDKHANYPTERVCDDSGFWGFDSCAPNGGTSYVDAFANRNVGELNSPNKINCVSSTIKVNTAMECFWTGDYFNGWYDNQCCGTPGYRDWLNWFMSSPNTYDYGIY